MDPWGSWVVVADLASWNSIEFVYICLVFVSTKLFVFVVDFVGTPYLVSNLYLIDVFF